MEVEWQPVFVGAAIGFGGVMAIFSAAVILWCAGSVVQRWHFRQKLLVAQPQQRTMRLLRSDVPRTICSICLEDLHDDRSEFEGLLLTPCDHWSHWTCSLKWFAAAGACTCPVCRKSFQLTKAVHGLQWRYHEVMRYRCTFEDGVCDECTRGKEEYFRMLAEEAMVNDVQNHESKDSPNAGLLSDMDADDVRDSVAASSLRQRCVGKAATPSQGS